MNVLVCLVVLHAATATLATTEEPPESETCQRCGCNTYCTNETCFCESPFVGDPNFMCYLTNNTFCSIRNDPRVDIFTNQHFSEKLMADVLAADVRTDRKARGDGHCHMKVWTYLNRIKGKLYVTEVQLELVQEAVNQTARFVMKVVGTVYTDGVYHFDAYYLHPNGTFIHWFQTRSDSPFIMLRQVNQLFCELEFLRVRPNIFKVEAACCGIMIGFRPYNPYTPSIMPGFFINIEGDYNPTFPENSLAPPLCLYDHQVDVSSITGFPDDIDSLVYLALINSQVNPPFSDTPSNLANLRSTLQACSGAGKFKFIKFFQDVLGDPPFVKDISNNVPGLFELVNFLTLVLNDICGVDSNGCDHAQALILARSGPAALTKLGPYC